MDAEYLVVGAGIMGLWSALLLREAGHDVLLVDSWEPGHSRATSADENRVTRCGYGGSRMYAEWSLRSQRIWARREKSWGVPLFHRCGVLWMVTGEQHYAERCMDDLESLKIPHERLDRAVFERRYRQIRPQGIRWALLEPEAGALSARAACLALAGAFRQAGGRILMASVQPPAARVGRTARLRQVSCASGQVLRAGHYLFACGPWLPGMFPRLLGGRIKVSHKEVFYFGTPPGDDRFSAPRMPVWMELGAGCYGVPALEGKGFKVHPDLQGRRVDPTCLERRTSPRFLAMARECLRRRFPDLERSPVIETRVCQYEATADDHMIFDRHPGFDNVWIVGAGSGHCFKHGPVIGEMVAEVLTGGRIERIPSPLRLSHVASGRNF
ncbi:MAG TPA: FAD-dependent oxidoreductase [Patescibacteria group bacterium]|jgi:glycine/D-amino acid oxidase-like deaminating enzyme|nr:FAD-dependent oxidoreductase [Patescibacteria group bacterium]